MPRIGHIAIRSSHPGKAADFFTTAFGFREVQRFGLDPSRPDEAPNPSGVSLTDGMINLTFLKVDAENLGCGEDFLGIQHFGIVVDDLDAWTKKLESLGAPCIIGLDRLPANAHVEIKFRGPDGVVFDISPSAWPGTDESGKAK
jgi:catechol 2,3-dioxygenase-like lactoylglutathione lyase family enzyme